MAKIAEHVWKLVQEDLSIQKDINRGLINVRALARYLIEKHELEASLESVISAIRRFEFKKSQESEKRFLRLFKDAKISTRNSIICFTLGKDATKLLGKVSSKNIRLIVSTEQIKVICTKQDAESLSDIFSGHIERVEKDLGELSLVVSEEVIKSKGVMARIANEIALHDINIQETIICPPEFLIYVKQEDVITTHEAVLKLSS